MTQHVICRSLSSGRGAAKAARGRHFIRDGGGGRPPPPPQGYAGSGAELNSNFNTLQGKEHLFSICVAA